MKRSGLEEILRNKVKKSQSILDFKLQESGSNISSGAKQLLCICRAVNRKAKVVILDEATSNIDSLTEDLVQKLLANELKECTVITIAHRLNTIINSDRICVLGKEERDG